MTPQETVERALALSKADGCVVLATERSEVNLRWANNTLTTNGSMRSRDVAVISVNRKFFDTPAYRQALADFVQWAKSTPGTMDQRPADGLLAYLAKTYPCPRGK